MFQPMQTGYPCIQPLKLIFPSFKFPEKLLLCTCYCELMISAELTRTGIHDSSMKLAIEKNFTSFSVKCLLAEYLKCFDLIRPSKMIDKLSY
jgi:hypothetical protein